MTGSRSSPRRGCSACSRPSTSPGLFQTADYAAAVLGAVVDLLQVPNDIAEAVQARMERRHILHRGRHRFHAVLCEVALTAGVVPAGVLPAQLDQLLGDMALKNVRLGVIPTSADHGSLPLTGFWILDRRVVQVETLAASLALTQPHEVALYERAFDRLAASAVYGDPARRLIAAARRSGLMILQTAAKPWLEVKSAA